MIFTYWQGDRACLDAFLGDWRRAGHDVRVFDESDVTPLIATFYPAFCYTLYDQLRIAACKSDIARLVLLERHGGLYVDAHTGPGNPNALARLLAMLDAKELVLFDQAAEHAHPDDIYLLNGAMLARAGSRLPRLIAESAFNNLLEHWAKERHAGQHVAYNIFAMTGGWNILTALFDLGKRPPKIRPPHAAAVHLEVLHPSRGEAGFHWYRHYQYREPGRHWSERQKVERLFDPDRRWWAPPLVSEA